MGNQVRVMTDDRKVIGQLNTSLACYAVVNRIVEKYTGEKLPIFGDVNEALNRTSKLCKDYEDIQLLLFINDKSKFDREDIPKFDEAIEKWDFGNDGPLTHLKFIRSLLVEHGRILTEFAGVSTSVATFTH